MNFPLKLGHSATIDVLAKENDEVIKIWRKWADEYCNRQREALDKLAYRILNESFSAK